MAEEDVNHAFKELQILHRMWKEDIGPVARELREEVWHRFSEATKKIHKRRHEYQDQLDEKFKANVGLKLAVIDKINNIDKARIRIIKTGRKVLRNLKGSGMNFLLLVKFQNQRMKKSGSYLENLQEVLTREKNSFYKSIKKDQSENLKKKLRLWNRPSH